MRSSLSELLSKTPYSTTDSDLPFAGIGERPPELSRLRTSRAENTRFEAGLEHRTTSFSRHVPKCVDVRLLSITPPFLSLP